MKRIIIHIGTKKTGSTALQNFFTLNNETLKQKGIYYYKPVTRYRPYPGENNGDFLDALFHYHNLNEKQQEEETNNFKSSINRYDTLIISDELLWVRGKKFWNDVKSFIENSSQEKVNIEIVVYLRNQEDYFISDWKEMVKSHMPMHRNFYPKKFMRVIFNNQSDWQYNQILTNLEEIFGINHIRLRLYDKRHFIAGNIFNDFCDSLNIPIEDDYKYPNRSESNISCTTDVSFAFAFINTLADFAKHRDDLDFKLKIKEAGIRYSIKHPEKEHTTLLSKEEREDLLRYCENDNREIAQRYFGRDELFDKTADNIKLYKPSKIRILKIACVILKEVLFNNQDNNVDLKI